MAWEWRPAFGTSPKPSCSSSAAWRRAGKGPRCADRAGGHDSYAGRPDRARQRGAGGRGGAAAARLAPTAPTVDFVPVRRTNSTLTPGRASLPVVCVTNRPATVTTGPRASPATPPVGGRPRARCAPARRRPARAATARAVALIDGQLLQAQALDPRVVDREPARRAL